MSRLRDIYRSKVAPALQEKFGYKNLMAVPRMEKIVVSMGVGSLWFVRPRRACRTLRFAQVMRRG